MKMPTTAPMATGSNNAPPISQGSCGSYSWVTW